jgi:hypothetical protein
MNRFVGEERDISIVEHEPAPKKRHDDDDFEGKHPRGAGGKFGSGEGATSGPKVGDISASSGMKSRTDRDKAIASGVARNQISVWDVAKGEEIKTGGTGR